MSQKLTTSFVNTSVPGAYPQINVLSNPVGVGSSGVITLIGEAAGGPDFTAEANLSFNFFSPSQLDQVTAKYISGNIVDAFRALTAPSSDPGIQGSANQIYIIKTNAGTQSSAVIASYGTLSDQNFGVNGNKYNYGISTLLPEIAPFIDGTVIPAFGSALNGDSFSIRLEGGASSTITLSATPADHANVAALVIELNAMLPAGITASPGTASNTIALTINPDVANYAKGWGKSFELIDSSPGDLAAIGLVPGLFVSSQESEIIISINRTDNNTNEQLEADGDVGLEIGYEGTTATLTINATTLSTTVVGGSGANLSIILSHYTTINDLANYINSQTGYSASVVSIATSLPPSALDHVTAIGICSTEAALEPGRIKIALYNFEKAMLNSPALSFVNSAFQGLPTPFSGVVYLTGGTLGATTSQDIVNAFDAAEALTTNFIVPLFSEDASKDIVLGITDPSSTYTIAAVNALAKSHVIAMSTTKMKKNRQAFLSSLDTFQNDISQSASLSAFRTSLCIQSPSQVNSQGVLVNFQPWYSAVIAAGMQAAGFYKAIFNKLVNVISYQDPTGYASNNPGDIEQALDSGLLVFEQTTAGITFVSDQTNYGFDSNFVYNSIQAIYNVDLVAIDLSNSFYQTFGGQSVADISAPTALSFLAEKMDAYRKIKLITASDDAPLGFKNAKVSIAGPIMTVNVEIKPSTSLYFIPITINVSQVTSTASA